MSGGLSIPVAWATGIVPGFGARRAPAPLWLPSALFAEAQPGIWLDGSDNSVMWQDAAGTTPVTALGQPVGLILDKRMWGGKTYAQVMAAQPELNTNPGGPFLDTAGWTAQQGTMSVVGGKLRATRAAGTNGRATTPIACIVGRPYRVNVSGMAATATGAIVIARSAGSTAGAPLSMTSDGAYTFIATQTTHYVMVLASSGADGTYVECGAVSVREIPSTPAQQTTSASRPVWREDDLGARGLQFDGVDDFLVTPSIDFSGSDKMLVAAGVRKLSDAAVGTVAELSTAATSNAGAFIMRAPTGAGGSGYHFTSSGTSFVSAVSSHIYPAPISSVVTGLGDISGDLATLRVNGSQVAQNTGDQGSGNYGSYPLYIGRRAGTSLPFNGFLHQLVVRGGALPDAAELAQLEAFIASKSGVAP